MAVSKKKARTSLKTRSAKSTRKIAETQARYTTYEVSPKPPASETHLEFFVTLPRQANVEKFMDALIDLVENAGGTLGGGTVMPEA